MIISIGRYEWQIPDGSMIKSGRKIVGEVKVKSDAYWAIEEGYKIVSPTGRHITRQPRMKCHAHGCGEGYLIKEGKSRFCEKCRAEYEWNRFSKGWDRIMDFRTNGEIGKVKNQRSDFLDHIIKSVDKFKMAETGVKTVDRFVPCTKKIEYVGSRKTMCPDGKIRMIYWTHVDRGVKIVRYEEIPRFKKKSFDIGENMATVENGMGRYAGHKVLRLKQFNGTMPAESEYHIIIGEEVSYQPSVKVKKKVQNKKVKRKSHAKKHMIKKTSEVDAVGKRIDREARHINEEMESLLERLEKLES